MADSEHFKWPPCCTLTFYHETDDEDEDGDEDGQAIWGFEEESHDRRLDFFETVMANSFGERVIRFEVTSHSVRWPVWTERRPAKIEDHIRQDLDADSCEVRITRLEGIGRPCADGTMWQLHIVDREWHPRTEH